MMKKAMGVFLWLLEYGALVLICLGVKYSSDYTFRFLILYLICQGLFGHYQMKTILIWDEVRLLTLSHLSFFLTSLILLPTMYLTWGLILKNLLITGMMFIIDIILSRSLRMLLNKQVAERVMIVGVGKEAKALADVCRTNRFSMMNVVCVLDPNIKGSVNVMNDVPYLADKVFPIEHMVEQMMTNRVTELILAAPEMNQKYLDSIVHVANLYINKIKYMPRIRDLVTFDTRIEDFDGLLVISRSAEKKSFVKYAIKRIIDILGGLAGCLFVLPLTLYVRHVNHKHGDFEPVYFKQPRIGKDGNTFVMYKFRTMVPNAEEKLKDMMEQNPEIRKEYEENKKLRDDPRVTTAGKMLRSRSLDEFPQFINVLRGEMSVVGPRPYLPGEKEDMGEYYDSVIGSKPGITGMWQSHGRNDVGFEDRCKMDDYYYRNWSLWLDITILIKTVKSVFMKDGAL